MEAEFWKRVEDLFHAAKALPVGERAEFLDLTCGGDGRLRVEVQALLKYDLDTGRFLATPPVAALESARPAGPALATGTVVGSFDILGLLGRGGMGEVYRARDRRLSRDVAIKVLTRLTGQRREPLASFEFEARAAARITHPNIAAVYDIGTHEGMPYLVSELVEGEPLRTLLARGRLKLETAIDYAIQIANGLAAAHERGIVHMDIKPENLMVTGGRVKIVDFGLARTVDAERYGEQTAAAPTPTRILQTFTGVIYGTPPYTAPEQIKGEGVDHRSDIFSFGCVLYEMITGQPAFQGESRTTTALAILRDLPRPIRDFGVSVSSSLDRVLEDCLEKDPERRSGSISEIRLRMEQIAQTEFRQGGRRKRALAGILGAMVLAGGTVGSAIYRRPNANVTSSAEWAQLTDFTDFATQPALSPDGRMLAFIRGPGTFATSGQVYVKALPLGEPVPITQDSTNKMSPVFSPDGSHIAYSLTTSWDTWMAPVQGGTPQRLLSNASGLTWADPRRILFSYIKRGKLMVLVTGTEDGTEWREIYAPEQETGMAHRSYRSPDGKSILVVEMDSSGWLPCRLVPFDGSSRGRQVGPPHSACTTAAWSPDGNWMYFSVDSGSGYHIWRQRFPDGLTEQVTSGASEEEGIAMAPDGRSFVTSVGVTLSNVWFHDRNGDRQISSEGSALLPTLDGGTGGLAHSVFSPDGGKLYYITGRRVSSRKNELRVADLSRGNNKPVLTDFPTVNFDISPDGKRVIFAAADGQRMQRLWLASLDGQAAPRKIGAGPTSDSRPVYGPDGYVYFQAVESGSTFVCRMKEDGTGREKLIRDPIIQFQSVSPDGQWVIAQAAVSGEDTSRGVLAYSLRDGSRLRVCHHLCFPQWTVDGNHFLITFTSMSDSALGERTFSIPLAAGQLFPALPRDGARSSDDLMHIEGAKAIDGAIYFAPRSSAYAFTSNIVHRNLYRVQVPR